MACESNPQSSTVAEELEGHDRDARRDADDPLAIERRGDRARDVRAVEVVVEVVDRVVVVAEVPAVDVVDVAVAVVVDAVGLLAGARLARVRPGSRGEVGMAEVDAVVDDRDDDAGVAGRDPERLAAVDVDVGRAARPGLALVDVLAGVVEAPQLVPERLARRVGVAVTPMVDAHAQDVRVGRRAAMVSPSAPAVPGRPTRVAGSAEIRARRADGVSAPLRGSSLAGT